MAIRRTALYIISAISLAIILLHGLQWLGGDENMEVIPSVFILLRIKDILCLHLQCCEAYLPNIDKILLYMKNNFHDKLHGQIIASEAIISTIEQKYDNVSSGLPIAIELYGPPGTGKSYTSELIADSMFSRGMKTPLVHEFYGEDIQFPEDKLANYKDLLNNWMVGNLTKCRKSMFIFKHTEKIPAQLLDVIHHVLKLKIGGIFIFTTTEKGPIVNKLYYHQLKHGYKKRYMKPLHFKAALRRPLFNLTGRALFLPMEVKDLKYCMMDEFERLRYFVPSQCMMDAVYKSITVSQYTYTDTTCKDIVEETRYVSDHGSC